MYDPCGPSSCACDQFSTGRFPVALYILNILFLETGITEVFKNFHSRLNKPYFVAPTDNQQVPKNFVLFYTNCSAVAIWWENTIIATMLAIDLHDCRLNKNN